MAERGRAHSVAHGAYTLRFEIADGGTLQRLISPSDLRRGRFDRVCPVFSSA